MGWLWEVRRGGRGGRAGLTFGDAQVGRPGDVFVVPAAVDVVESGGVLEIGPVDCELVVRVQLALYRVVRLPGIWTRALEHEHAVIDCRAGIVAQHVGLWRRGFGIRVRSEDDVPFRVYVMQLWSPKAV